MRGLHPGRLRLREVQLILEVLVHDVDQAIAEAPEEKEGAHEAKCKPEVPAVFGHEDAAEGGAHTGWSHVGDPSNSSVTLQCRLNLGDRDAQNLARDGIQFAFGAREMNGLASV